MNIDISIIVPVYNAEKYISECIDSIANQTFRGTVECIIVDDCGQDNSMSQAEDLISRCSLANINFIILRQEHNQGPSAARNAGTRTAHGKYIFYLDCDDKITPSCLDTLFNLAIQYDADYVQGTYVSDEHYHMPIYGDEIPDFTNCRSFIKHTLLNYNIIPFTPHNRLVRRKLILDHNLFFNEQIMVREDFYWMFFMAKHVERLAFCKLATYYRGFNADSLTHNINLEREIMAYRTLVTDFCKHIDDFRPGEQKTLILNTLIMALRSQYYHNDQERQQLISAVTSINTFSENLLFKIFLSTNNSMILHLLIRLYRLND